MAVFKPNRPVPGNLPHWPAVIGTLVSWALLAVFVFLFPPQTTLLIFIGLLLVLFAVTFSATLLLGNWSAGFLTGVIVVLLLTLQIFFALNALILINAALFILLLYIYLLL